MADPTTAAEIAASLTVDQIPVKLRCAACTQLASNAFRMPCCDQSICETCQQSLDDACPICLHEPVKAEDCKINKALRNTIKALLKKKAIERDQALKKELASKASAAPVVQGNSETKQAPNDQSSRPSVPPTDGQTGSNGDPPAEPRGVSEVAKLTNDSEGKRDGCSPLSESQKDVPQPSIETSNAENPPINGCEQDDQTAEQQVQAGQGEQNQKDLGTQDGQPSQDQMIEMQKQWAAMQGMNNGGLGYDGMLGGFPNINYNNPADYAQMMQYMQNGMPNNMAGGFPGMMSMPGMGMNPMAMSQGMYGGYNGQGMGMNGMNAGMGYANGQGAYGGYNGQSASWSGAQNNYNQNAYGGHANGMMGDYGSNAGYGGYNQGNYNQMNHRNFPSNEFQNGYRGQGYQPRGRGRGRGYQNYGRGRGGYNQVNHGYQADYDAYHQQTSPQASGQEHDQQTAPSQYQQDQQGQQPGAEATDQQDVPTHSAEAQKLADDFSKSLDPGDAEDHAEVLNNSTTQEESSDAVVDNQEVPPKPDQPAQTDAVVEDEAKEKPAPIETFISSEVQEPETIKPDSAVDASTAMPPPPSPAVPTGPAALSTVEQSQTFEHSPRGRGRGYHAGIVGHRGGLRGRGSGYLPNGALAHAPNGQTSLASPAPPVAPIVPKGLGVEGAPKGPKAMREVQPSNGVNGGKGFSIVGRASAAAQTLAHSQATSRSPSPKRSRSRSPTRSHRHRHHRHRSADSSHSSDRDRKRERHHRRSRKYDEEEVDREYDSKAADSSSRRSSHRHRDHDREKEPGRSSHRSHRSHRDRSKDREGHHRSSRKRSRSPDADVERSEKVNGLVQVNGMNPVNGIAPPSGPRADREKPKEEEVSLSGRKKRERDEVDEFGRERKRSKSGKSEALENEDQHRGTKRANREDANKGPHKPATPSQDRAPEKSQPPASPKVGVDPHTLEREARNRERLQKEMQRRRSAVDTKGSGPKRKISGAMGAGRRVSYKYEDEESSEARTSRVESEREASRWG